MCIKLLDYKEGLRSWISLTHPSLEDLEEQNVFITSLELAVLASSSISTKPVKLAG